MYPRVTVDSSQQFEYISANFEMIVPFPDFITSARRELMLSAVFLTFFTGAIVARSRSLYLVLNVIVVVRSGVDGFEVFDFREKRGLEELQWATLRRHYSNMMPEAPAQSHD